PVPRPYTEPDGLLFQPGRFIILCEAKFTSPNPVYVRGPRQDAQSLTLDELIEIYSDPSLVLLDQGKVHRSNRIAYQLFRNVRFPEYMARLDGPYTKPYFCNLTRFGECNETFEEFYRLVQPAFADRIVHLFWEQLFTLAGLTGTSLRR